MKYYRVTAFFPDAPSPAAHKRMLVRAGNFGAAIARALAIFRAQDDLKRRRLSSVQVTATVDSNAVAKPDQPVRLPGEAARGVEDGKWSEVKSR